MIVFALTLAGTLLLRPLPAADAPSAEEAKAAALYNIIRFTDWPEHAFSSPTAPLVLGIVGQGPIASLLPSMVEGETWQGRKVVLQYFATSQDIKPCHVLFIAQSARSRWPAIRSQCAGRLILTVSDAPNFARQDGIVQLEVERNKLRLLINLRAVPAGLKISSKVLRLAEVIGAENK